jgi:hypothetical protein
MRGASDYLADLSWSYQRDRVIHSVDMMDIAGNGGASTGD